MCGIAGYLATDGEHFPHSRLADMLGALEHRGPDGAGTHAWMSPPAGSNDRRSTSGIAACRLCLLDPRGGRQPFTGRQGGMLAYNGEIYNWRQLRRDLCSTGHAFWTQSDTEVLSVVWETKGIAGLNELDGMFAFAVSEPDRITLVRDPFGMKPLYCASDSRTWFAFASEAKALLQLSCVKPGLNLVSLFDSAAFGYPLDHGSFFEGIWQLPPGCVLEATIGADARLHVTTQTYGDVKPASVSVSSSSDAGALADDLLPALVDAVAEHLEADYPVGLFLSGGLDSSVLLGSAALVAGKRPKAYTFADDKENEDLLVARAVAASSCSEHHEVAVPFSEYLAEVPHAVRTLESPRAPTGSEFLARAARTKVKAALCGEGCDEVFGGYWFHRDPDTFLSVVAQRYLGLFRLLGISNPGLAERSRRTLRALAAGTAPDRRIDIWRFMLGSQLSDGHLIPWDHSTMGESLELRLPYLSRRIWSVVQEHGLNPMFPLGLKRIIHLLGSRLLPVDIAPIVLGRKKIGFPSSSHRYAVRFVEAAGRIVPSVHVQTHPLRSLVPLFARLSPPMPSTASAVGGSLSPRPGEGVQDSAAAADLLLIDLFLLIFCVHRGVVPSGLSIHSLYAERKFREPLLDALAGIRAQVRTNTGQITDEDLVREAFAAC